jgi:hypothetical protein
MRFALYNLSSPHYATKLGWGLQMTYNSLPSNLLIPTIAMRVAVCSAGLKPILRTALALIILDVNNRNTF